MHKYMAFVRATPHSSTGRAPNELLMGRRLKLKIPGLLGKFDSEVKNIIWVPQSATHAFIIITLIKTEMLNLKPKENMSFFLTSLVLKLFKF